MTNSRAYPVSMSARVPGQELTVTAHRSVASKRVVPSTNIRFPRIVEQNQGDIYLAGKLPRSVNGSS